MLRTLLVLLLTVGLAAEQLRWFAPLPAERLATWPAALAVTEAAATDPWWQDAGIQPGDHLVAVAGAPVSNTAEMLAWLHDQDPAERIPITIRRDSELVDCALRHPLSLAQEHQTMPLRPLLPDQAAWLAERDLALPPDVAPLPDRILHLWIATDDPTAFDDQLVLGAWVQACRGEPVALPPRHADHLFLATFLQHLATPQPPPTWAAGPAPVDAAWRIFGHPWRGTPLPPIGDLVHADDRFLDLFHARWQGRQQAERRRYAQDLLTRHEADPSFADVYHHIALASLLDAESYLGWLTSSAPMTDSGRRRMVVEDLTLRLGLADEAEVPWLAYSLLGPLAMAGRSEELALLIRRIDHSSPLLGRLAADVALSILTAGGEPLTDAGADLRERLAQHQLLPPERPADPLVDWLVEEQLLMTWLVPSGCALRPAALARPARLVDACRPFGVLRHQTWEDHEALATEYNNMAWDVATDQRMLDPATARIHLAVMLQQTRWSMPLFRRDTVASLYARIGDYDNAVWWQADCVREAASQAGLRAQEATADYRKRLRWYQAGEGALETPAGEAVERHDTLADGSVQRWVERDDLPNGPWSVVQPDGTPIETGFKKDGQPAGYWRHYDAQGRISAAGSYAEGMRLGPWRFSVDGVLRRTGSYATRYRRGSVRLGEWTWYDATGAPVCRGFYAMGRRSGDWQLRQADGSWATVPAREVDLDAFDPDGEPAEETPDPGLELHVLPGP